MGMQRRAAVQPTQPAGADAPSQRARLEAMFEAHHELVWRTLRRYGLDAEAAADVAQQAFLVAVERIDDIWQGSERAFLVGTALRLAASARRKAARWQLEAQMDVHAPTVSRDQPERQTRVLQMLDLALAQLDAKLVEVFVLFDIEGLSAPEISQALQIPTGTVASRLRRAREDFRAVAQRLQSIGKREEGVR